jgi:hypothetical protein
MDIYDLREAELEADLNSLSTDDWEVSVECRQERYLYHVLQLILLGRVSDLPETHITGGPQ